MKYIRFSKLDLFINACKLNLIYTFQIDVKKNISMENIMTI